MRTRANGWTRRGKDRSLQGGESAAGKVFPNQSWQREGPAATRPFEDSIANYHHHPIGFCHRNPGAATSPWEAGLGPGVLELEIPDCHNRLIEQMTCHGLLAVVNMVLPLPWRPMLC